MEQPDDRRISHLVILQKLVDQAKEFFNSRNVSPGVQLVVLDIDGTALDDTCRVPEVPQFFVAFEPILDLYKFLLTRRYKIIFLTGRQEIWRQGTEENLRGVGYHTYDHLVMMSSGNRSSISEIGAWKDLQRCRFKEELDYHLVACIGDQDMDTCGEHIGEYQLRLPIPPHANQRCVI